MCKVFKLLALLAGLSALNCAAGPEEKIVTDRPDFVESSEVVGRGRVQIETSFAQERSNRAGERERVNSTPTLIRIGLTDTLELRYETEGHIHSALHSGANTSAYVSDGHGDYSLGVKWHMADAREQMPSLGLLVHMEFDSGSAQFRAPGKSGSLRLAAEWELPGEMGLGVMPGLSWQAQPLGGRATSAMLGVVLSKEWSEQFRTFIEYSAPQIARSRHGGVLHTVDLGMAYLLSDNCQLDTALSRGLNQQTPRLSWTVGLSYKF